MLNLFVILNKCVERNASRGKIFVQVKMLVYKLGFI